MYTLDDRLTVALQEARRHHLGWWLGELEQHRGCSGFKVWSDPFTLEYGFICNCHGIEERYAIRVHDLKEALPDARASVLRLWKHEGLRGSKARKKQEHRANTRAMALLRRHLTLEQRWELRATGGFRVTGVDGRGYTIRKGACNNIFTEWQGHELSLCVIPKEGGCLPLGDTMLFQKVLLETDVEKILDPAQVYDRTANLIYGSGKFLRDGSSPMERDSGRRVMRVVPNVVLDTPVNFMTAQMAPGGLTAITEVVLEEELERIETRVL